MKFEDSKPKIGKERVSIGDVIDLCQFPKDKWITVRILPEEIIAVKQHWINIIAGKDKREVRIPKFCISFDPNNDSEPKKGVSCPYCELAGNQDSVFYLSNVIVRALQEDMPRKLSISAEERKSGFKEKGSSSYTPVRVLRATSSLAAKLRDLQDLNKVKTPKGIKKFSITHERYGCDVNIKHNPNAKGPEQYQVQLGERSPLSEEELSYLIYELNESILDKCGRETVAEAKKELKRMQIVGEDELDEDDDEEMNLGKSRSKFDEDDDEEERRPRKKSRSKFDDDDDEEDGDEEEERLSRKKSRSRFDDDDDDVPTRKKSRSKFDEDDDEEERRPRKKSRSKFDDDDDEEDDVPF